MIEGLPGGRSWVFAFAREKAEEICEKRETSYAPMVARLIPGHFMLYIAKECLAFALSGTVMTGIVDRLTNAPRVVTDEDRLHQVRLDLSSEWGRYLSGDFSWIVEEGEDLEFKRRIIAAGLQGLNSQAELEHALKAGSDILKPSLFAAADAIRARCKHKVSIVLTGSRSLDSEQGIKRLADTARGLKALKAARDAS